MPNEFVPSDAELQHHINQLEAKAAAHQAEANKYSEMAQGASDQERKALIEKAKQEYRDAQNCRSQANDLRKLLKQRQDQQRQKFSEATKEVMKAREREEAARQKTLEEQRQKQMQEVARNAASLSQQPMTQLPSNQRTQG
ncbi:MAG: hypothetical protein IM550_01960 [Microcystis sp. M54BS1]|uniref:hypothetical protein n=1 Tax=unclassified Microcystis TaxID=2643300 RepID=UPI0025807064|nr:MULTISPECIES: hypothetical protein [unclassified Microcystis]MCA2538044.1 hypothetical protein [Microcystis sp. M54BS1]MCA2595101.1 hypothetical protein [Microcystis sp. M38BS1]MCA2608831.1 hypothetical protein [Microcystis sp. M27BS1]MCA2506038.1 hypothetical protein [Microcystis sp. M62BS1]MCA2509060.1 hypothetical protein [Microcystis sp. M60BS1]